MKSISVHWEFTRWDSALLVSRALTKNLEDSFTYFTDKETEA